MSTPKPDNKQKGAGASQGAATGASATGAQAGAGTQTGAGAPPAPPSQTEAGTRTRSSISTERRLAIIVTGLVAIFDKIITAAEQNLNAVKAALKDGVPLFVTAKDLANEVGGKQLAIVDARLVAVAAELRALDFSIPANAAPGKELMNELQRLTKKKEAIQGLVGGSAS